jgi:hypothetical protein
MIPAFLLALLYP